MEAAVESLLGNIEKSGLLTPEQLTAARAAAEQAPTPVIVARNLIAQGLLTRWQATQLLGGRNLTSFVLGKYKLLELLGRGGMGNVYLAQHVAMNRRVALKLLSRSLDRDPVARERFFDEARAAASLDHPNIVRAYNIDSANDRHFMVMEYVDGRDLQRVVEEDGPLSYEAAADAIRQAADGLAHAHGRNMIHCDIKPANLLRNSQGVVKILDLGLARLTRNSDGKATGDEKELGTVDYMSPEQALGVSFDHRTDIYSLGCTLYFLLTGGPPFPEGTLHERIVKHQVEQPRSILEIRPSTPRSLVRICRKMMSKYPSERFESAAEVSRALTELKLQPELRRAVAIDENGLPVEDRPVGSLSATLRAQSARKSVFPAGVQALIIAASALTVLLLAVVGAVAVAALLRDTQGKPSPEPAVTSPRRPVGQVNSHLQPAAKPAEFELPSVEQRWEGVPTTAEAVPAPSGGFQAEQSPANMPAAAAQESPPSAEDKDGKSIGTATAPSPSAKSRQPKKGAKGSQEQRFTP